MTTCISLFTTLLVCPYSPQRLFTIDWQFHNVQSVKYDSNFVPQLPTFFFFFTFVFSYRNCHLLFLSAMNQLRLTVPEKNRRVPQRRGGEMPEKSSITWEKSIYYFVVNKTALRESWQRNQERQRQASTHRQNSRSKADEHSGKKKKCWTLWNEIRVVFDAFGRCKIVSQL